MLKQALIASSALALVAFATPSFAGTSGNVTVQGQVDATCNIASSALADFHSIALDSNGVVTAANTTTVETGGAWCNGNHNTFKVTAVRMSLDPAVTAAPGFASTIDYTISGGVLGASTVASDGLEHDLSETGAFNIADSIETLTTTAGTYKQQAGGYQGVVHVSVTPGI